MEFAIVPVRSEKLHTLDGDASLATRAAWLHFAAGFTQSEVASRLNIPSTKAPRLVARRGQLPSPDPRAQRRQGDRGRPWSHARSRRRADAPDARAGRAVRVLA